MGLLDVLTGMRNGPRGMGGGCMSPITMALLGLLAYKAVKGSSAPPASATQGTDRPGETSLAGGLSDILDKIGMGHSPLARTLGAGGLGGILSGGLGDLLKQFQGAGKGDVADSWVGKGPNKQVAPQDLSAILTEDQVAFLMEKTGLSREDLLKGLADELPRAVDELTPTGRLPSPREIDNAI